MRTIPFPTLSSFARLGAISLAVVVTLGACSEGDDELSDLSPPFAELDLSTPATAVSTFGQAFDREDYLTAYRVLSEDAQLVVMRIAESLGAPVFPSTSETPDWAGTQYRSAATEALQRRIESADWIDTWAWAVELHVEVQLADMVRNGALTVDLTGGIEAIEVTSLDDEAGEAVALGRLEATGGEVRITLERDVNGRWRVRQLLVDGGRSELYPFAGPEDAPPSQIEATDWEPTIDRIRHDDPDELVRQTVDLFERRDWRLFLSSMHPESTRTMVNVLARQGFEGRFLTLDTPPYDDLILRYVDVGSGSVGGFNLIPLEHGVATDSLLVDLDGGEAEPAEPTERWAGHEARAATVATDGGEFVVVVAQLDDGRWALAQVRTPDGGTTTESTPFSAPAPRFDVPAGAEVCPDGIVRYRCFWEPPFDISEADQARIATLEAESLADPNVAAQNALIIDSILNQARTVPVLAVCTAMQLGYVHDDTIDWSISAADVQRLADDYCPGDPSVIPTG